MSSSGGCPGTFDYIVYKPKYLYILTKQFNFTWNMKKNTENISSTAVFGAQNDVKAVGS